MDDVGKVLVMCSVDVYCVFNIGGESFGIVLVEVMVVGIVVVVSDFDVFWCVLCDGEVGYLVLVDLLDL